MSAAGPTPISGAGGVSSDATFKAGKYDLSETTLPGYTPGAWICVGGTQNGASIALAIGESATCTITNDDQPAHLILVKKVTNDNGGTAVATDFTLSANGPTPISGNGGADSDVNAGTYDLSEAGPGGYSTTGYDCGASVTLALGETKTCTITNDDIQPKLTVIKKVINDNGGTKAISDFPLNVGSTWVTSGATNGFNVGAYLVGETNQPGYAATFSGDCDASGNVSLALGDNKTCTITNNDIKPKLTLVKTVVNDNGGTKTVADFKLFVNGSQVTSSATNEFNAGTYSASETNLYGYTAGAWGGDCAANGSVTLAIGDNKTCTITNDDQPGIIIIKKITRGCFGIISFSKE